MQKNEKLKTIPIEALQLQTMLRIYILVFPQVWIEDKDALGKSEIEPPGEIS